MSSVRGQFFQDCSSATVSDFPAINTGVYSSQALERLIGTRVIRSIQPIEAAQVQPASLDLRLGRKAYRINASFLPGPDRTALGRAMELGAVEIDLSGGALFERGSVYLVELQESLALPADLYGVANPKSSTGRLDILTRLITDAAPEFDRAAEGYNGPLYIEVAPLSFGVFVREGDRLNQLRIQRGKELPVAQHRMRELYADGKLAAGVRNRAPLRNDQLVPVTIDLRGAGPGAVMAYRAKRGTTVVDLRCVDHYEPQRFWQPEYATSGRLQLERDAFYILATREHIGVPHHLAAEMVPYDSRSGEFRVHYAGFFDPGFGLVGGKASGSRAVLEVRSYGVPFMLEHEQIVGWLRYAPIAANETPDKLYGESLSSNYQGQGLKLAKQFKVWLDDPPSMQSPVEDMPTMLTKHFSDRSA